jgi:hypothetical protein
MSTLKVSLNNVAPLESLHDHHLNLHYLNLHYHSHHWNPERHVTQKKNDQKKGNIQCQENVITAHEMGLDPWTPLSANFNHD